MRPFDEMDQRAVTALRVLAVDEVEQARSGHPGMPLGASPMAYVLWSRFLRHDSADPAWPDRDRFVLSAGHASAMLYALLHLFGYGLPLEELKRFRQWGSKTPGHPEHGLTPGVETTTGPLGQGLATAVGMALAERHLAARFNRDGFPVVGHRTWVIASDGDMMEGVSHEAASLAGHLRLGRLAVLYDDNHVTIEGATDLAFSEDVEARFAAYGWRTFHVDDGNDLAAIAAALERTAAAEDAPALVRIRTHIGWGSPKQDSSKAHGEPLGPEAAAATRAALGWTITEPFVVPDEIRRRFSEHGQRGAALRGAWVELLARYRQAHPGDAAQFERRLAGDLPAGWDAVVPSFAPGSQLATRQASGKTLNALAPVIPELIGGAGDLAPSTDTLLAGEESVAPGSYEGRNLHFGIREHAMAAAANGMALHGGVRPFVATFFVFSDYLRPAMRLAALMRLPVTYVFTHDSIGLGEDGPTHQPIEHMVALRVIPNMVALRPGDANETAQAWRVALERRDGPTALVLTRQKLPVLPPPPAGAVARGAYVRAEAGGGAPDVVLIGTGSELALALAVREELEARGLPTRVVSAPSLELLARQSEAYQNAVLGPRRALRVAIEAGRGQGWHRWVGDGEIVSLSRFGASAPGPEVMAHLGYSVAAVAARVEAAVASRRWSPIAASVPDALRSRADAARDRLHAARAAERVTARDSGLWGDAAAASAARRLGWLDLPDRSRRALPELERLVAALAGDGARTLVLLGMGGSSLAPEVLRATYGTPAGRDLIALDTTDPDRVGDALRGLEPASLAVVAISKSGTTAETSALLEIMWEGVHAALAERAGGRFVAVTEPGTPLARLARERGFRAVLDHPVDVGGRYSTLSPVGILPAVWLGAPVEELLAAGERALARLGDGHPAVELAVLLAAAAPHGWGKLVWAASPALGALGAWAEQLVAESTGKDGRGILPVVLAQPPAAGESWPGAVFVSPRIAGEDTAELDRALAAVAAANSVARWRLAPDGLGEAFVTLELATALTGHLLGVNPFDEPDVVRAKERARAALAGGRRAAPAATADPRAALARHLRGVAADDAVVLLAYLPERPAVAAALAALGRTLSRALRVPVTAAFGPRYLHSTGQLHKGGPAHIVPVVLTGAPRADLPIPGQPHTLGQLRLAQATGDIEALTEVGRNVLHLHLAGDAAAALAGLAEGW
ncbi:MAG: transketolase [Acidobacteria bacterium]|nr:MAG: transketolase [Acidobacteriota bacterium]